MLTALAIIAVLAAIAIGVILVLAAAKPDTFRVERTATIAAPPENIFALINDFRHWPAWSPYEQIDPTMKRQLSGAENGTGAVYEWEGGGKAGHGRMEIIEAAAPSRISIDLQFAKPFKVHNLAEFKLSPADGATRVTWSITGGNPFASKVMQTVFNMDRMIGNDFETGLSNLKDIAEQGRPRAETVV